MNTDKHRFLKQDKTDFKVIYLNLSVFYPYESVKICG